MRYPADHKRETRERVLVEAAKQIRAHGPLGVGVADIMKQAGLTHGGFYAHFKSKDALVAEAFDFACEQSGRKLEAAAARAPDGEKLLAVADAYLTAAHAARPQQGCPISTVGPDLVRAGGDAREAVGDAMRQRLEWLESIAPGQTKDARRRHAAATYATMLGGILVARALGGSEGERYLELVRRSLRQTLSAGG